MTDGASTRAISLDATTAADYRAVRERAGVADVSERGVLEVTGRDRATFLHALLTNDVKSLAPGQGCAATLLDIHGKVQVSLLVLVLDDRIVLVTPAGMAAATVEMLDKYLFAEKVVLDDVSEARALLLVAGPEAPALVARVAGVAPVERAWSSAAGAVDGVQALVVRGAAETGEPEIWLLLPADARQRAWSAVTAAGARPVGEATLETLRIEAGTPRFGEDIGPSVLLPEVPFEHLVSHTKGCYPGQEVVVRIRDRGHVNRHLRGLVLDGDAVPEVGAEVVVDGTSVGQITSAALSPRLGRPVALAFVRRQHADEGARVAVRSGASTTPATVHVLPFAAR
jgi:folate-binding protein YgfZ